MAGVGTGGAITGAGQFLREENPEIQLIAVEPKHREVIPVMSPSNQRNSGFDDRSMSQPRKQVLNRIFCCVHRDQSKKIRVVAEQRNIDGFCITTYETQPESSAS